MYLNCRFDVLLDTIYTNLVILSYTMQPKCCDISNDCDSILKFVNKWRKNNFQLKYQKY